MTKVMLDKEESAEAYIVTKGLIEDLDAAISRLKILVGHTTTNTEPLEFYKKTLEIMRDELRFSLPRL